MAELPRLVIRTAPVKPSPHWLVTTYWQLPAGAAELATEEAILLDEDDDERMLLDDELITLLVLLTTELEELATDDELSPTMPQGAGCALQVARAIQLWLFSHPQPLLVVTHKG